jgi:hypothetical protein
MHNELICREFVETTLVQFEHRSSGVERFLVLKQRVTFLDAITPVAREIFSKDFGHE